MRLLFTILVICALPLAAQEKSPDPVPNPKPKPSGQGRSFSKEYQTLVFEAMRSFQGHDYKTALALADKADALVPPTPLTLNMRGAVAIELKQFDEGLKYCQRALELDPKYFPAKFNICEIQFLQGKYGEARQMWQTLYESYRADYSAIAKNDDEIPELLIYRITVALLLDKDFVHAKEWMEKIPFPSTTPAYQYAHAAYEREQGNMAKWEEWLKSARFIWPETKRVNFNDVLVQLKWLKDEAAPEGKK